LDTILKVDNLRMNQIGPVVSEKIFYKVYDDAYYTQRQNLARFTNIAADRGSKP